MASQKYFSPSKKAFYVEGVNEDIPTDAVKVADDQYGLLLTAQAHGKTITVGTDGAPTAATVTVSTTSLLASLRKARNKLLKSSDYTQLSDVPIGDTLKAKWATYRQNLRDLPEVYASNPSDVVWPTAPDYTATSDTTSTESTSDSSDTASTSTASTETTTTTTASTTSTDDTSTTSTTSTGSTATTTTSTTSTDTDSSATTTTSTTSTDTDADTSTTSTTATTSTASTTSTSTKSSS